MGENSSRRHSKLFNWILNNLKHCVDFVKRLRNYVPLPPLPSVPGGSTFQDLHLQSRCTTGYRSPGVTGITFDPVGFLHGKIKALFLFSLVGIPGKPE